MRHIEDLIDTLVYDETKEQELAEVVGKRIEKIREEQNISRIKLADACACSESFIYNTEHGNTKVTLTNLLKICTALEVQVEDIVTPELYS